MKKTLLTVSTLILLTFTACAPKTANEPAPTPYHDAPTQFIVTDIKSLEGMKAMTTYYVEVVDANGLVSSSHSTSENLKFWFCDSIGKYRLGQPIHFDFHR